MAAETLSHAERARTAHQALRLLEAGLDSERKIREVAATAPAARILGVRGDGEQRIAQGAPNPHAGIALELVSRLEPDLPGPTDRKTTERILSRGNLTDVWKEWDAAVTANLEETLDAKELKAWRDSVARDEAGALERHERMLDTGDAFDVHPYFGHMRHTEGAANALYDLGREGFANADIDLLVATVKWVLVDSADYTVNLATHQFLSSVAGAGRVATTAGLANKTTAAGVFDADDIGFGNVSGDPSEALVLVQSSAVGGGADVADTAQRLIGYVDTATGLPVTPNGGAINVVHDSGSNRIFKL